MAAIIDYRGRSPSKTTFGVPLVTAKIIKAGRIEPAEEFIAEADYENWMSRGLPREGDVVLTTEAPLGEVAQLDGSKVALAQRVITLRGRPGLMDQNFLRYLLQSEPVQNELRSRATGTTVLGIRQSELRKVPLTFPEFEQQVATGALLRSLDDKIELNRRMSHTLEAIAQAIFKSWFVDFEPVQAKAAGSSNEDVAERFGLPINLAATLPNRLVQHSDELLAPEGWVVDELSKAVELNPRRTLRAGAVAPYLDMASVPTNSARAADPVSRAAGSGSRFVNGDTLMARITPCLENGKTCYVDFLPQGQVGWGSTEFIVMRPANDLPAVLGYFVARDPRVRAHAIASMTGTSGRQRVSADALGRLPMVVPPKPFAEAFAKLANAAMAQIASLDRESLELGRARDLLLPRMLSGELSCGETTA